jgi:hypothetical protein
VPVALSATCYDGQWLPFYFFNTARAQWSGVCYRNTPGLSELECVSIAWYQNSGGRYQLVPRSVEALGRERPEIPYFWC